MFAQLIQDPQKAANFVETPAKPPAWDAFGQLPALTSDFHHTDGLFYFTYAVCVFFFVLIVGALLYSVVFYRRKRYDQPAASNVTHNTPLEVVWTVIPLIIVMVMFGWGFQGTIDMMTAPADARQCVAQAKQWTWTFQYPNDTTPSYGEVWVEKDKPVQFLLESADVLHAFFAPSFRVKRDVVPGRMQSLWFTPRELGDFHLFCAEYCGQDHSKMYAQIHVVTGEEYSRRPWDQWKDATPEEAAESGARLYKSAGCVSCHSLDGSKMVGPSWKGIFAKNNDGTFTGRESEVVEGGARKKITVDRAYIQESIRKPEQKKVVGFESANMTAFDFDDRHIDGLIEFMKSLAK
ncbi:MAG: cytochrome c oxidase subunit II [Planctomycetota bacterium]